MTRLHAVHVFVALLLALQGCVGSEQPDDPDSSVDSSVEGDALGNDSGQPSCHDQTFEDIQVPLSDGNFLAGFVRRPQDPACRMPTILLQTPYNVENARSLWFMSEEQMPLFESMDYAFVVVDWRGFHGSAAAAISYPDYGADGFDVVEWIAAQPWSDGQVGTWGVSALGRVQYWTAVEQPPHLVTCVPIFAAINNTYREFYPGGVLRREYIDFLGMIYGSNQVEQHPLHDSTWRWLERQHQVGSVQVPMLVVGGWYDLENKRSFFDFADLVADSDSTVQGLHRLLVGPWSHFATGGESGGIGRDFTAQELKFIDVDANVQRASLAWFDHHLRGLETEASTWAAVRWFQGGDRTWHDSDHWPPSTMQVHNFYLHPEGTLQDAPETGQELTWNYDPDDPSPTIGGQTLRFDLLHGPTDQQEVIDRDDALVFLTDPLTEDLQIHGPIEVHLAVTTTGADTDFAVRITDVDDSGQHLLLSSGIRRLSLRDSYDVQSPVVPQTVYEIVVPVTNELGYQFAAGHRVGLIVTSSNWPRFSRNPNNGDHFYTDVASSVTVTNSILCDGRSFLALPLD